MARTNDSIGESELDGRYGEIGISAVAAALQYKSNMNFEAVEQRRSRRTRLTPKFEKNLVHLHARMRARVSRA
jgi:hypothetical protein